MYRTSVKVPNSLRLQPSYDRRLFEEENMKRVILGLSVTCLVVLGLAFVRQIAPPVVASDTDANCDGLPDERTLRRLLREAPGAGGDAGGLFHGTRMWGAIVNRNGQICAYATSTTNPTQVWPGSQAIAKSKAYTANAFSLDTLALSTARLYTFTQPGHSLWSLGQSNLFDASQLQPPRGGDDRGDIVGGLIFFGGGVALYSDGGRVIGGLGISGDTSCADHEIAKRVRNLAHLNPPDGHLVDDITYSAPDGPSVFTHPLCVNTWRNGVFVGNEAPATGY
jgi:uncharacterized protein GlcG (DUF336 family)